MAHKPTPGCYFDIYFSSVSWSERLSTDSDLPSRPWLLMPHDENYVLPPRSAVDKFGIAEKITQNRIFERSEEKCQL